MSRNCERANIAVFIGIVLLIILPVSRAEGAGDNEPNLFDLAHTVLWEGLIILAVLGMWLIWTKWSSRESLRQRHSGQNSIEIAG